MYTSVFSLGMKQVLWLRICAWQNMLWVMSYRFWT